MKKEELKDLPTSKLYDKYVLLLDEYIQTNSSKNARSILRKLEKIRGVIQEREPFNIERIADYAK